MTYIYSLLLDREPFYITLNYRVTFCETLFWMIFAYLRHIFFLLAIPPSTSSGSFLVLYILEGKPILFELMTFFHASFSVAEKSVWRCDLDPGPDSHFNLFCFTPGIEVHLSHLVWKSYREHYVLLNVMCMWLYTKLLWYSDTSYNTGYRMRNWMKLWVRTDRIQH